MPTKLTLKSVAVIFISLLVLNACDSNISGSSSTLNSWLQGNPTQWADFAAHAEDGPVVMLNLLKFATATDENGKTGAQSYAEYLKLSGPIAARHGGIKLWSGAPTQQLIGDMEYDWDLVLLVSWPKRQNLLELANDPDYKAISHLRGAGLKRSMLIAMDEMK